MGTEMFLMLATSKFLLFLRFSVMNSGMFLSQKMEMISSVLSLLFRNLVLERTECLYIFFLSLRIRCLQSVISWTKGEKKLFIDFSDLLILFITKHSIHLYEQRLFELAKYQDSYSSIIRNRTGNLHWEYSYMQTKFKSFGLQDSVYTILRVQLVD